MDIDFVDDSVNYYEIVLCASSNEENEKIYRDVQWNTRLDKDMFMSLLSNVSNVGGGLKYFQKNYKEQVWTNIHYQNTDNEELRIIKKECMGSSIYKNKFLAMGFSKTKMSLLNIPSTSDIYSTSEVSRLTFRISNRVYVNFEVQNIEDIDYYKIYINYNHDKNVDPISVRKQLQQAISLLR